ncbi:MAG: hypothetical protein R3330_13855, partial [Saprospiraceae bacterium]|nr:hypothetical protein [Saprospiraceae bacterium]
MTKSLQLLFGTGALTLALLFAPAQAQNDIVAPETGPVAVELSPPVDNPVLRGGLLYDNGPLVNSVGTGVGGQDESVLQSVTLGMNTLGFGNQVVNQNFMADDFTVPAPGWDINEVVTWAYQTNGGPGGSTMTQVHMCIWDGPPSTSPNLVWGDCATNVMNSTVFSNILRVSETTTGTTDNRSIYTQTSDVVVSLAPGTYWLMWATDGTLASGPWAPPITITGETTTGNAEQCLAGTTGGVCGPALDSGTATQQGVPFQLYGSVVPVELLSFDATVSGQDVILNWATSSETNNAGFEVQV